MAFLLMKVLPVVILIAGFRAISVKALVISRNDTIQGRSLNSTDLSLLNSTREGRRSVVSGGLFSIVSFDNVPCNTDLGNIGTCYSPRECTNLGGAPEGVCAGNYGVCCVVSPTCDAIVTTNNTYFVNPGSTTSGPLSCSITVNKLPGATELYLEFTDFQLMGPSMGNCRNDTFTVTGTGTTVPPLCGNGVGQMLYYDITSSSGPFTIKINLASTSDKRSWKIRIVQFLRGDGCAAPQGCQQYLRTTSGTLESFNFNGGKGELINNYCYTICFKLLPGYCNVILTENEFMIGGTAPSDCTSDYLLANGNKFCGDTLANGMLTVNQTTTAGYIPITFCSGSDNADMNLGYSLNYTEGACPTTG